MKIKPFTLFLCAVALILIALSPWLIQSYYTEQPGVVPYKGILKLWNVSGWRTGGSSISAFLKKRIAEFESKNPYVFIEIEQMSADEAEEAIENGESPDIISYPYGLDPGMAFCSLPNMENKFSDLSNKAYPYMCGGYCLMINTDMLNQNALFPPEGWGVCPEELADIAKLGVCFDSEDGYTSLPAIALHEYPEISGPNISTWDKPEPPDAALNLPVLEYGNGLQLFRSEKTCILIASHRQLFEATRRYIDGESPPFSAYALSGYTDMLQMVSVTECDDKKKQAVCIEFAQYLLSAPVQKKLEALGVFPVIPELEIFEDNNCLYSMYGLLNKSGCAADPRGKETLEDLARQSFDGNRTALKKLRRLLGAS